MTVLTCHVDAPKPDAVHRRGVAVRGWAHFAGRRPLGVRLRVAGLTAAGSVGHPRPDVAAALPDSPRSGDAGFEVRTGLPPGRHEARLEFLDGDAWHAGPTLPLRVDPGRLPAWLRADAAELLAFQLPAHAQHAPRPVRPERFPRARGRGRPALSIVTPSFNQARFLGAALASVAAGGADTRHVVQDGGSKDGSVAILAAHARPGYSWESAPDDGQADAIVRGFARTTGGPDDVMAWLNADDLYLPGALGFVADYFASHPEVDVVYGNRVLVDEDGAEIGRWHLPRHDDAVLRLNDFVPQETLFWRRRLWDRVGGLDRSLRFALDWDLLLRFAQAGARIVHVPYFLACFRIHAAQKTSAHMHDVGQAEIDRLRERSQGRPVPAEELARDPRLLRYLRRSARVEWLAGWSLRTH